MTPNPCRLHTYRLSHSRRGFPFFHFSFLHTLVLLLLNHHHLSHLSHFLVNCIQTHLLFSSSSFSHLLPAPPPTLLEMRELSELPWPAPVGQLEEEPPVREQGDLSPRTPPEPPPLPIYYQCKHTYAVSLTSTTQAVVLHLLSLQP